MGKMINRLRTRRGARRYLSGNLSVADFFQELHVRGVDYVVLRWYESLPDVDPGEDIDILVADDDLEKISLLLKGRRSKHQPIDLYSVSGLARSDFNGLPYYHPEIAKGILDRSDLWNGLCRVPSPRDAFLSMAYHVVYHKGLASNVPASRGTKTANVDCGDHDYVAVLEGKAESAGISLTSLDINLEDLDDLLGKLGWRPPIDTLTKLSGRNVWLGNLLATNDEDVPKNLAGLACFIVRERGIELLPEIRTRIELDGFDILWETSLEDEVREAVRSHVRGGVWSHGPWPINGGEPAHLIIAYDVFPIPPEDWERAMHPGLNNRRLIGAKEAIRDLYNLDRPPEERCNIAHSSDNAGHALHHLRLVAPEIEEDIKAQADQIYRKHQSPFPILAELGGNSRRAKVYLIVYKGQTAVLKFFRAGRERFMQREIAARELGKSLSEISDILEIGENYLVLKHYRNSGQLYWLGVPGISFLGFIRPTYLRRIRKVLLHFRKSGFEYIDLRPGNLIVDVNEGLKFLDFEFLQRASNQSGGLDGALAFFATGADFDGDLPVDFDRRIVAPYEQLLRPHTGVRKGLLLDDSPEWRLALAQIGSGISTVARKSFRSAALRKARLRGRLLNIARRLVD